MDHRLLIAALTPRSIGAGGRFSNEAFGVRLPSIFETFVHSGITSSGATSAQAYEALQLTLHLDTWVRRIYLRSADEFSKEQRIDLLQAVVASVFFTSGMDATLAWLSDCVEPKLSGMTTLNLKTAGLRPYEILRIGSSELCRHVELHHLATKLRSRVEPGFAARISLFGSRPRTRYGA